MRSRLIGWALVLGTPGCEAVLGADFGPRTLDPVSSSSAGGMGGSAAVGGEGGATTTAGGSGGSGGEGGSAPTDCWGLDPTAWTETTIVKNAFAGSGPTDFALTPDGLTLTYVAQTTTGDWRPHAATRSARNMPFDAGMAVAEWPGFPMLGHVYSAGTEMIFQSDVSQSTTDWELYLSVYNGQDWSAPSRALAAHTMAGYDDKFGHIVEDGMRLFFVRNDGQMTPLGPRHQLYEATRAPASSLGSPFANETLVTIDSIANDAHYYCIAPSPDGQRLFLGTTDGLAQDPADPATRLYYLERTPSGWTTPVHLASLERSVPAINCPTSVTADGCELVVLGYDTSNTYVIAERGQ